MSDRFYRVPESMLMPQVAEADRRWKRIEEMVGAIAAGEDGAFVVSNPGLIVDSAEALINEIDRRRAESREG